MEITETLEASAMVDVDTGEIALTVRDTHGGSGPLAWSRRMDATGALKLASLLKAAARTSQSRAPIKVLE